MERLEAGNQGNGVAEDAGGGARAACKKCGAALTPGRKFCAACGTPVLEAFEHQNAKPVSLGVKLALAGVAALVIALAAIVNRGLPSSTDPITLTGSVSRDASAQGRFTVRNGDPFAWTNVVLEIHDARGDYKDRVARIDPGSSAEVDSRDFIRADGAHYQVRAGQTVNFVVSATTSKGPGIYETLGV